MRYLSVALAGVLMACTVPPSTPIAEAVPPDTAPVESKPVTPKPASPKHYRPSLKVPAVETPKETAEPSDPACAGIKTGNVKEDIHLKLDCLLSPVDGK